MRRPSINARLGALLGALALLLSGCAGTYQPMGPVNGPPRLADGAIVAADGRRLALRVWRPEGDPAAVVLALHGFDDYSNAFDGPARWWAARGIATYAYDQRGFGDDPNPGIWAGAETMVRDAATAAELIRARHPGVPFFLLGESMGGAVVLALLDSEVAPRPPVDGAVLAAPAVWGRKSMPFYQRWALSIAVNLFPGMVLTGEGLDILPSDNIEMLRGLAADPLVLKENRVDTLNGLVTLMDHGMEGAGNTGVPTLYLYGEKEEVLPLEVVDDLIRSLPPDPDRTVAFYEEGYHMLLRDLQAPVVWRDVAAWIADPRAPLPSGADRRALARNGEVAEGDGPTAQIPPKREELPR